MGKENTCLDFHCNQTSVSLVVRTLTARILSRSRLTPSPPWATHPIPPELEYEQGTSMACPHVSGVAAQVLQHNPTFTPAQVLSAMQCNAARGTIRSDGITAPLLVQTPTSSSRATCDRGAATGWGAPGTETGLSSGGTVDEPTCMNDCGGHGVCDPRHVWTSPSSSSSSSVSASSYSSCICDSTYYGLDCSLQVDPACRAGAAVTINMSDDEGDGWSLATLSITYKGPAPSSLTSSSSSLSSDALQTMTTPATAAPPSVDTLVYKDSLAFGDRGSISVCLFDGLYAMDVTRGAYPAEVHWSACGASVS